MVETQHEIRKTKRKKISELYNPIFWLDHKNLTDVEISKILGCAHSTVRQARIKNKIKPIPVSEATQRQWNNKEFRKKVSATPQIYEEDFWIENKHKTNSEIAKEIGSYPEVVSRARAFVGLKKMTKSESQKRRFKRDRISDLTKRIELDPKTRKSCFERANNTCEIPVCESKYLLQAEHILDQAKHQDREESNRVENIVILCQPHHIWWSKIKNSLKIEKENPRRTFHEKMKELFP